VLSALGKLGITGHGGRSGHAVKGQAPFGRDLRDARFVKNTGEQQVIRLMRQLQDGGASLHGVPHEQNRRLVPTRNAGLWQAKTVAKILRRRVRVGT
jgi:hypothetical protein